jgi:hypothetical protein
MSSTEVVTTENEQSISQRALAGVAGLANMLPGFEVAKQVTRRVLKQEDGIPFFIRIDGEIYEGEALEKQRGKDPAMAPARLCHVLNLATKENMLLVANTVLEGELDRNYPDGAYVGKYFAMRRYPGPVKANGREYKVYEILELTPQADAPHGASATIVADGSDPVNRKGNKPGTRSKVEAPAIDAETAAE